MEGARCQPKGLKINFYIFYWFSWTKLGKNDMSYAMCLSNKGKYTTEIEPIETCGLFSRYIAVFRDYFEKIIYD